MAPNLDVLQHNLIRDMILDESLTNLLCQRLAGKTNRSFWNVPGGNIRNMPEPPGGSIPTELNLLGTVYKHQHSQAPLYMI